MKELKEINSNKIGDEHVVYQISFNGVVRYIGVTCNLKRREYQHQRGLDRVSKPLYERMIQFGDSVWLEKIASFNDRNEAELFELHLILEDYFSNKFLINDLPKRIKYF